MPSTGDLILLSSTVYIYDFTLFYTCFDWDVMWLHVRAIDS